MLRLWPETVNLCLLPGASWVHRRGKATDIDTGDAVDGEALIASLLGRTEASPLFGKGARVNVIVPDGLAQLMPLPWQPALTTQQQLQAYARASLAAQGACAEGQWAVQGAFRKYGQPGLAVAVSTASIDLLRSGLAACGARLQSVMPLSIAVYWSHRPRGRRGWSLALVREHTRLTALAYSGGAFMEFDAEPVAGTVDASMRRLGRRLGAAGVTPSHITVWDGARQPVEQGTLLQLWPEASVERADRSRWSVR